MTQDSDSAFSADGLSIEQKLQELNSAIDAEQALWQTNQINPGMIQVDAYMVHCKMQTVLRVLKERLDMSEEELLLIFKEEILNQMRNDRRMIIQARAAESSLAIAQSKIIGANGQPLN